MPSRPKLPLTRLDLPPRIYPKGRWYYLVTADGKRRIWTKVTLIRDGISALYAKLADMAARDVVPDRIPALAVDWLRDVASGHSIKTQANERWVMTTISESLAEFRASNLEPPDVATFLRAFRDKPRTHNEMRAGLRELMRYAEEHGYRPAGTNPVDSLRTMTVTARSRYITDSELRRIKRAALVGADGQRTRSGPMLCCLIDLAYLTGQRISDLLDLRWSKRLATDKIGRVVAPYIDTEGIYFKPGKTASSTGASVLIGWTPRLRALVDRVKAIGRTNLRYVITTQDAQRYTYYGASTAWRRAVQRSGIADCHFHDLRAKALTDKEAAQGLQAARRMGAHSTEGQTADYVRHKTAQRTEATR